MAAPRIVFVLGRSGVGKGTICQKLAQEFGFIHLSAGELLREEGLTNKAVAEQMAKSTREGTMVPSSITVKLLDRWIQKHAAEGRTTFLIDGFPRNQDNLNGWNEAITEEKAAVKIVLYLRVTMETAKERALKRGRKDDNSETLRKRMAYFDEFTLPVIDDFKKTDFFREVNASQSVDDVYEQVKNILLRS